MMWHFSNQACCFSDVGSSGRSGYHNARCLDLSQRGHRFLVTHCYRLAMPDNEEISILSYAHCDNILVRCERATSNRYVALTCAEYLTMPPALSAEFSAYEEPQHA